ncbi:hypothetical protein ACWAUC_15250 [Bradyrhizobium guangdongense]
MLTLRLIGPNDYTAHENGQPIGRIRFDDHSRQRSIWLWTVTVPLSVVRRRWNARSQGAVGPYAS